MSTLLLLCLLVSSHALSQPVGSKLVQSSLSPQNPQAGCWRLMLDVGREQGTWMPPEWGSSGTRLAIPLLVDFLPLRSNLEDDPLVGRNSLLVKPVDEATFINENGEQTIQVQAGGWSVEPPKEGKSPAVLRFWLDFGEGGEKRDTVLPPGRVFFTAAGWMDEEIEVGNKARSGLVSLLENDILVKLKAAQEDYDQANALAKVGKLSNLVGLSTKRDNTMARIRSIDKSLPKKGDGNLKPGKFPFIESRFRIAGGGLCVKRPGKVMGSEYHILGTWSCTPVDTDESLRS
ncbi:hypothetical protein TrVE_jg4752 [Triparma verrucosa]|uniref:Uncharacterized protein n=1 Tax=Triparma verrucosa TaxID=1606542 RepID=A0A9W7C3Z8_9STRA|nr:hypothetical protein TrVE_jg4752 [Triparma verrucosa]